MVDWFFHLAFVGLFLAFFGISGYYFCRAKRLRGEVSYIEGRGHRALRLLVGVPFMLALAGYMLWPGLLAWAAFPLPAWARGLGLALGLVSVALMVWVQRALMLSTFGDTYQGYMQRTGRFLPRWILR